MKKKLPLLVLALIIAVVIFAVWYSRGLRKEIDEANARITAESQPGATGEGIGGMSITGMEIVQGEKGQEVWRLTAKDAVMSEQGGDIIAQKPYLTYYFGSEEARAAGKHDVLIVVSDTGDVNQISNRIRFIGNVVATHENEVLTTSLIVYDGKNNRLDCPEESAIKTDAMSGRAKVMSWHLDDNTLHASGGVSLDVATSRASLPGVTK